MSTKNGGGPAFPAQDWQAKGNHHPGMSLRDWFAGQALAGMLSSDGRPDGDQAEAEWAYDLADAMLRAREKGEAQKASGWADGVIYVREKSGALAELKVSNNPKGSQ